MTVLAVLALPATARAAEVRIVRADGTALDPVAVAGTQTLASILERAGVEPADLRFADVEGEALRLTRRLAFAADTELADGSAGLRLDSARGSVTGDDHALDVRLGLGDPLVVRPGASKLRVDPGETVVFTAAVGGLERDQEATVRWTWGDGSARGTGERTHHAFTRPGLYQVTAKVSAGGGSTSDIVGIRVRPGASTATPEPTRTATATPSVGPPATGGGGGGGGTPAPPRAQPTATTSATAAPTAAPVATPFGELVTGELLTAGSTAPGPAAAPRRRPRPRRDEGDFHVPAGVVAVAAILLAFGAGFRLDMRGARPTWT